MPRLDVRGCDRQPACYIPWAVTERDALNVLRLQPGCSRDEVRQAYLDLVRVWHPDRFYGDDRLRQKAERAVQELNDAYETLRRAGTSTPPRPEEPPRAGTPQTRQPDHRVPNSSFGLGTGILAGAAVGALVAVGLAVWSGPLRAPALLAPATKVEVQPATRVAIAPRPPRPESGTEMLAPAARGGGSLVVMNAGRLDAVVVLSQDERYARGVYVRAGEQVTVADVGAGTYRVLIASGRGWAGDRFTSEASYQQIDEPITFVERDQGDTVEYTRLTVSFQSVVVGGYGTRRIAPFRLPRVN